MKIALTCMGIFLGFCCCAMSPYQDDLYENFEDSRLSSSPRSGKLRSYKSLPELPSIKSEKSPSIDTTWEFPDNGENIEANPSQNELSPANGATNVHNRRHTLNDSLPTVLMIPIPSVYQIPCVILPPSLELPTANILENEDNSLPFSTLKTQKTSEDRKKKERANLEEEKRKKRKEDEIAWQKEIKRGQLLRSFKDESCSSLTPTDVEKVLERYCKQQELPNDARCAKFINKTSIGGITAATPTLVATGVEAISGGLGLTTMASLIGSPIILSFSMFGYLATRSKVIKAEQKQLMYNYLKDNDYPRQLQKLRNYTTMLLPNV